MYALQSIKAYASTQGQTYCERILIKNDIDFIFIFFFDGEANNNQNSNGYSYKSSTFDVKTTFFHEDFDEDIHM